MNQLAKSIAILALFLILAACAPEPVGPSPVPGDGSGSSGAAASTPLPEVNTTNEPTLAVSPAATLVLSEITPTAVGSLTPTSTPNGGSTVVTLQDSGKTLTLHVGERFLLQLGEIYTWQVIVADQSVVGRVKNVMVMRGAQGLYQALHSGQTEVSAQGDPACRSARPACAMPSIMFRLTVVVE